MRRRRERDGDRNLGLRECRRRGWRECTERGGFGRCVLVVVSEVRDGGGCC